MQWEYKVGWAQDDESLMRMLNEAGADGWEAVSHVRTASDQVQDPRSSFSSSFYAVRRHEVLFKRPKEEKMPSGEFVSIRAPTEEELIKMMEVPFPLPPDVPTGVITITKE